jgi:GH35 family endo-1,4-beta-xylanase
MLREVREDIIGRKCLLRGSDLEVVVQLFSSCTTLILWMFKDNYVWIRSVSKKKGSIYWKPIFVDLIF